MLDIKSMTGAIISTAHPFWPWLVEFEARALVC